MIEQDTIKLLRECDAGVKMGVASIDDVLDNVRSDKLKQLLSECKREHEMLSGEIQTRLERYHDDGTHGLKYGDDQRLDAQRPDMGKLKFTADGIGDESQRGGGDQMHPFKGIGGQQL